MPLSPHTAAEFSKSDLNSGSLIFLCMDAKSKPQKEYIRKNPATQIKNSIRTKVNCQPIFISRNGRDTHN